MKGKCFSEALFHATMDGRKTQFREEVKSRTGFYQVCSKNGVVTDIWQTDANEWCGDNLIPVKPRYKVGETVYLKEPYCGELDFYTYKFSDLESPIFGDKWKNPLFMPEVAARHFIKITNVRAERLRDISDEDCLKEGIQPFTKDGSVYKYGLDGDVWATMPRTPREAYSVIFDKINGKGSWDKNSWVWVYDYQILK